MLQNFYNETIFKPQSKSYEIHMKVMAKEEQVIIEITYIVTNKMF
jgi:hypothetical protein